jgi:sec-independent protein translocase protein TatC
MSAATVPVDDDDGRMSLMEHLTELRDRIIKIAVAVVLGMVVAFLLYDVIFDFLIKPYQDSIPPGSDDALANGDLIQTDPLEGFAVRMKLALYGGIAFAMPVILWQLWRFITPGLYSHEKRYAIPFLVSALTLFVLGAGLAYYTLPQALNFLNSIGGDNLVTAYSPSKYFQLITYMMLAFGVGFEFPIILIFLMMAGILSSQTLRSGRRYAIVGICVLVAVITPSGDPISMLMLSGPMVVFYEISILVGRVLERRRAAAETA